MQPNILPLVFLVFLLFLGFSNGTDRIGLRLRLCVICHCDVNLIFKMAVVRICILCFNKFYYLS